MQYDPSTHMIEIAFLLSDPGLKGKVLRLYDIAKEQTNRILFTLRFEPGSANALVLPGGEEDTILWVHFIYDQPKGRERKLEEYKDELITEGTRLGGIQHWGKATNPCTNLENYAIVRPEMASGIAAFKTRRAAYDPQCVFCNAWYNDVINS